MTGLEATDRLGVDEIESLNVSEIKPKHLEALREQLKAPRSNMYSVRMSSIAGVSIMSPLKPKGGLSIDRSNIYSVKENYMRAGRQVRNMSRLELSQNITRNPELSRDLLSELRKPELSSQEHLELIWGNKLVEKMRLRYETDTIINPNIPQPCQTGLNEVMVEDKKSAETWKNLDKYLEDLLENSHEPVTRFLYFNMKRLASNPYDLDLTDYAGREKDGYYTISGKGITYYREDKATEFESLADWVQERDLYSSIKVIGFFKNFKRWKLLKVWRQQILSMKRKQVIENLSDKIFVIDNIYRDFILKHRKAMYQMSKIRLMDLDKQGFSLTIKDLVKRQKSNYSACANKIKSISNNCREQFKALIAKALEKLRGSIYTEDNAEEAKVAPDDELGGNPAFEAINFPRSLAYGDRASLRRECTRFLRLAYLTDFLSIEALGEIYIESVKEMLDRWNKVDESAKLEVILGQDIVQKIDVKEPIIQLALVFEHKEITEKDIVLEEIKEFTDNLSKPKEFNILCHIELAPDKTSSDPNKREEQYKTVKKYIKQSVPNIVHLWLDINPRQEDLLDALKKSIGEGLDVIYSFERWSKHSELVKYANVLEEWDEIIGGNWDEPESDYIDPICSIANNDVYKLKDKNLELVVLSAYKKVQDELKSFHKYLYAYWMNNKADFSLLFDERVLNPLDTLTNVLKLLEYQKAKFAAKIPKAFDFGLFKVDCTRIRKELLPAPKSAIKKIEVLASKVVRAHVEEIKNWITNSRNQLTIKIVGVDDYVNQKNSWNQISDLFQEMKDKIDICGNMHNVVAEFGIKISKEDKAFQGETLQDIVQLSQLIANVADQQEINLEKTKKKLKDNLIPELKAKLENLRNDVQDEKFLTKDESMDKVLTRIEALEATFRSCEELTEKYLNYQQTLNMEALDFSIVEEIREELSLRSDMWRSLRDWKSLTSKWITQQFSTINSKEISTKAEEFSKIARRVEKGLPANPIADELKDLVETFKKTVPVVKAFSNKSLEKYHWSTIKELLKAEFDIASPSFTLKSLLDLKVVDHQEEIELISQQAYQEALLKEQLAQLDEQWKKVTFTVKAYKYKDVYVLDEVELLLNTMDESLANINTILGSRYIKPLLSQAEGWRNSLLNLQTIVDEWITCQKRWIYLENIFSGQDIKKQLSNEASKFETVDKFFKNIMQRTFKTPQPFRLIKMLKFDLLESLKHHNKTLDEIEKLLEDYLETKRKDFPRFYFLSNDELLEILANQQKLETIQQSLRKCFDNLYRLDIQESLDILAMFSSEGERVPFSRITKAKDNVEIWLDALQSNMRDTLAKAMKVGLQDYDTSDRKDWVLTHYGQVVATVAQISWSSATEASILEMQANTNSLLEWYEENVGQIQQLTELVRGKLNSVQRKIIVALVTTDVHARDILESLVLDNVSHINDFNWQKQLRYYWDDEDYIQENKGCFIKQVAARLEYGYEYIGPSSRLVITPLTDRCWITITSALNIHLGSAPAGPAGTGKTESTKDLAKGLGMYCIVFNCSEQINYKMMGRLFSGVVQQGAWTCLDEFNRINVEVLSVVARQMMDIRMALIRGDEMFSFEDKEIKLKGNCGIFITMNPGYAGRTELPDNLKVHFRPVSMMIPDYELIAEIMLFAEGFGRAKALSKKMVKLYKLASEQLSQQDHYDFGMRAVKSVLVMAGSLKRAEPGLSEDAVLLRAMRDSNIPKFVKADLPLFHALIKDLFPTLEVEPVSYGALQQQIDESLSKLQFESVTEFVLKILQLYEISNIRFGVMIVGPTGSGKTACFEVLRNAITELHSKDPSNEAYYGINLDIMNPKAINLGELYGEVNNSTQEWRDGLASKLIRRAAEDATSDRFWIVFDGPVDSLWIENMNTVLDDTMTLCLSNGQRIKLRHEMKMLFEVQDLAAASPATVSRCGMVYIAGDTIGWKPYVHTWMKKTFGDESVLNTELQDNLLNLFDTTIERGLGKVRSGLHEPIPTVDLQLVAGLCNFLEILLIPKHLNGDMLYKKKVMLHIFMFSFVWGLCASIDELSKEKTVDVPGGQPCYNYYLDPKKDMSFRLWSEIMPTFVYTPNTPFFQLMVPTIETVRQGYCLELLLSKQKSVFFTGVTGIGKSIIIQHVLNALREKQVLIPVQIAFSAQTSSMKTQLSIEEKLQKKRRDLYGAQVGRKIAVFIDDVNMPSVEIYGAQPPIELLRMLVDKGGFYDREKLFWKWIEDTTLICAAGPPGGGRRELSQRFTRRFNMICISAPSRAVMQQIFQSILSEYMKANNYMESVKSMVEDLVISSIEVYDMICLHLKPTPSKFHYMFNMRDVSKIFQGVMMTKGINVGSGEALAKLWVHEVCRVFYDRLCTGEDKEWLARLATQYAGKYLKTIWEYEDIFVNGKIHWGDTLRLDSHVKYYEEIKDTIKLKKVLENQLDEYNVKAQKKMQLVFFEDAIEHILRISRVLKQPKGYIMLIGVGGSGKNVLTRLSAFMQNYNIKELEVKKDAGSDSLKDYMKDLLQETGVVGTQICLILTDTQVANEGLLEDVNSLLNNGEIPNLFTTDELDKLINDLRPAVAELKRDESRDSIYSFFVERIRNNLHISLCMSPAGDSLRLRCRKFPSLINCCTLNWFSNWPQNALLSVSNKFLEEIEGIEPNIRKALAEECVNVHTMIEEKAAELYAELRRKVYITPKSYLDLIALYVEGLRKKRTQAENGKKRLEGGIGKLKDTNVNIAQMKKRLEVLQPRLKEKSEVLEVSQKKVGEEQRFATEKEQIITIEKDEVDLKAKKAKAIAEEAESELNILKPELNAAMNEVRQLDRKSISEIKMFNNPPPLVVMVMESVMLLLDEKTDWNSIRSTLADSGEFVNRLVNFGDKVVQLPESVIKKLRINYLSNPEFDPEKVASKALAAKTIVKWVKAMNKYYDVLRKVEPKRRKYEEEKTKLDLANSALSVKLKELDEIKARVAKLREDCEALQSERGKLAEEMAITRRRLSRAEELMSLLTDEDSRWNSAIIRIQEESGKLIGDVFLSAAFISYLGPFTGSYRESMINEWFKAITERKIPSSEKFVLTATMGDPLKIRNWQSFGLPTDSISIENAIIATEAIRFPLMVDPQMQANRWIKQLLKSQNLIITKLSSPDLMRTLSNAVRIGKPVLFEDVEETLDPSLDALLQRQIFTNETGIKFVRLDNKDVEFDFRFKLYMTSKLPNPHYMPEVSIKITVINFTVTFTGLEDQLLGDVVKQERPEIEEKRDGIIRQLGNDKKALSEAEENILKLLTNSTLEQLLDEEAAVNTLKNAKFTSAEIGRRMEESIKVEAQINIARNSYRSIAIRGSVIYFVVADLMNIDSMYQYSLDYIKQVFNTAIAKSPKSEIQEERMKLLIENITKSLYSNVSRGLFVAHKMIFSFLICTSIKRNEGVIEELEWSYFVRGAGVFKGEALPNPLPKTISSVGWTLALTLARNMPKKYADLVKDFTENKATWRKYAAGKQVQTDKLPGTWSDKLSAFQKLLVIKIFRPEMLLLASIEYVKEEIGKYFIENSAGTIKDVYQDSTSIAPIIFVLSQGADPTIMLLKFAEEHKFTERMSMLSLGQGQGPAARKLIQAAQIKGDWVLLQNCHLAKSWMKELEQAVEASKELKSLNASYRLFLTSMPADYFPASVLQNGVKLTTEPPRGIKANLRRSYLELTQAKFEGCKKQEPWKKLLLGLCFFHSVLQERRKFGPLGFNIRYEFNDSDLDTSITMLRMFLDNQEDIPWEALNYVTGDINYGGRVTDDWDRRCLLAILKVFYTPEILKNSYKFSVSGIYKAPLYETLEEYREYIESLPLNDPPEIFGMHENADIAYHLNESNTLIKTILKIQPKVAVTYIINNKLEL